MCKDSSRYSRIFCMQGDTLGRHRNIYTICGSPNIVMFIEPKGVQIVLWNRPAFHRRDQGSIPGKFVISLQKDSN